MLALRDVTLLVFVCFLYLVGTLTVDAHTTGASYEKEVSGHVIDIGYDPAYPAAGDSLLLDFRLSDTVARAPANFDNVWVRVAQSETLLLATGIAKAVYGPTTLLLKLPPETGGSISVSVRYEKGDETIAESTFDIPIQSRPTYSWLSSGLLGLALGGFLTGILLLYFKPGAIRTKLGMNA